MASDGSYTYLVPHRTKPVSDLDGAVERRPDSFGCGCLLVAMSLALIAGWTLGWMGVP